MKINVVPSAGGPGSVRNDDAYKSPSIPEIRFITLRFLGIVKTNYNTGIEERGYLTATHSEFHFLIPLSTIELRRAEQRILDSKGPTQAQKDKTIKALQDQFFGEEAEAFRRREAIRKGSEK